MNGSWLTFLLQWSRWATLEGEEQQPDAEEATKKRRKRKHDDQAEQKSALATKNGKVARESSATSILRKVSIALQADGLQHSAT